MQKNNKEIMMTTPIERRMITEDPLKTTEQQEIMIKEMNLRYNITLNYLRFQNIGRRSLIQMITQKRSERSMIERMSLRI